MISAGLDFMHANAVAFKAKLHQLGADVEHLCIPDVDHMFLHKRMIGPVVQAWDTMLSAITASRCAQEAP